MSVLRSPRAQWIGLATLAAVLIWQIVTQTFVAFLSGVEPGWALVLAPGHADAALRLADRKLGQDATQNGDDPDRLPAHDPAAARALIDAAALKGIPAPMLGPDIAPEDRAALRSLVARGWLNSPLDARAPRLLGQLAESDEAARAFMLRAGLLSKHETLAAYWQMQDAFLRGDQSAMLEQADIVLRTQPEVAPDVVPLLLRSASGPNGAEALESVLDGDPPWRWSFFASICPGLMHLSLPMDLFLHMRDNGHPPTANDVTPYLTCLTQHGVYPLAQDAWRRLLQGADTKASGLLFNGTFDVPSSGTPFDWTFRTAGGARIEVAEAPGKPGQNALKLAFLDQFIEAFVVAKLVVLPAGDYVLTGRQTGAFNAKHGLRWSVACVARPFAPFAQSDRLFGSASGWKDFAFAFSVPDKDCPAQIVNLRIDAVSESEWIVSGEAWFTDLALDPRP